ncbi:ribosomal protein L6, alpha-beta domain-containing protein [Cantharellus anzutake]|uniref:ribosomal protein L6, alpha-beta domain-containing protein n=1 Tax=Cantharellus anzutake TaxID=1750568 RepID=UPI0019065D2B|nr:ribosomal protein L6, alpha-beta domain-containing protein [Cantharellus anzutake]KAF8339177.1 ribosomal protein L6, alpha-beta domain-containing protein [Cantharellus anzutake]
MRPILTSEDLPIPDGVTVVIKSRIIEVKGPRGTLKKDLHHIAIDLQVVKTEEKSVVTFAIWHGGRKHIAAIRTVRSLINNMIIGVTKGFKYKMRAVYAHFPINCIIGEEGKSVEIRNFLGEKRVRHVDMLEGVTIVESKAMKDELFIEGNDVQNVSQSAASIQGICRVRKKDIRKFLDGIYVSDKGTVVEEEKEE